MVSAVSLIVPEDKAHTKYEFANRERKESFVLACLMYASLRGISLPATDTGYTSLSRVCCATISMNFGTVMSYKPDTPADHDRLYLIHPQRQTKEAPAETPPVVPAAAMTTTSSSAFGNLQKQSSRMKLSLPPKTLFVVPSN